MIYGEGAGAYRGKSWDRLVTRLVGDPDPHLRALLAEIGPLPVAVATKLADDGDTAVIIALLESGNSLEWITTHQVRRYLAIPDTNLHLMLVQSIHDFSPCCRDLMATELRTSPAAAVRKALADYFYARRTVLEELAEDEDGDVRDLAATTLAQTSGDNWDVDADEDDETW